MGQMTRLNCYGKERTVAASAIIKRDGTPGWAACNQYGRSWYVTEAEALEIETARKKRNADKGKPETPGT